MLIQDLRKRPTIELLEVVYGAQAPDILDKYGGSVAKVLRNTATAYSAGDVILHAARELVTRALHEELGGAHCLNRPQKVREYLTHRLFGLELELFLVLALDVRLRLICCEELFRGSLTQTSVYPREVVKFLLSVNADGAIFAHNHPSGLAEPSDSDRLLTTTLKQALALMGLKVHDHITIAGDKAFSFAERGPL
jgi:DNA repair protein RadC